MGKLPSDPVLREYDERLALLDSSLAASIYKVAQRHEVLGNELSLVVDEDMAHDRLPAGRVLLAILDHYYATDQAWACVIRITDSTSSTVEPTECAGSSSAGTLCSPG